jgi:hypothetical protein
MYLLKLDTDDLVWVRIIQRNNHNKTSNTLIPGQPPHELYHFVKMIEKHFQKNKNLVKITRESFEISYFIQTEAIIQQTCVEAAPPPLLCHDRLATQQAHHKIINFKLLEHLYQRSTCDPVRWKSLDEVPRSNSVKPLEDSLGTLKVTTAFRALRRGQ